MLLLALATVFFRVLFLFFRVLVLLAAALAIAGFLFRVYRIAVNRMGKVGRTAGEGKKIIDSSYKIVDDNEEPPK